MSDNTYIYVISPVVLALISGVKIYLGHLMKAEEKRRKALEDRMTENERIMNSYIKFSHKLISAVLACSTEGCQTKEVVRNIWEEFEADIYVNKKT